MELYLITQVFFSVSADKTYVQRKSPGADLFPSMYQIAKIDFNRVFNFFSSSVYLRM
jgi:hypothetical protein